MQVKRFLIIDDDEDDNELFTEALAAVESGIICYSAEDGQEAIDKLDAKVIGQPDIIFMDINMPVMNGWQCLTKLKSVSDYNGIPVIIYSTSSDKRDKELAKDMGAICFFTKFSDFKKLIKVLEIVIHKMNTNSIDAICNEVYRYLNLN
jgi:CheY-like chemotaxis protein